MDEKRIRRILGDVQKGRMDLDAALRALRLIPFEDLREARVDHHRDLRCGFPEVIFCQGKTPKDIERISRAILKRNEQLLATRADRRAYLAVRKVSPRARYHELARCVTVERRKRPRKDGLVLIISAGTSDIPVAEEARVTAEIMGNPVETLYDVGVAGIHRILGEMSRIMRARVIIVVAGMEGALASVVGGIARAPVIAVPTSVGYGASFGGLAPLLTMLNSCSAGVAVVNIDNGFGAGYIASAINETGGSRR